MSLRDVIPYLVPSTDQMLGHAAVAAVALGFIGLGGAVGGRRRWAEADLLAGWGVVVVAFTVGGALLELPLRGIAYALGVAAAAGLSRMVRRGEPLLPPGTGRLLLLTVPFMAVVAAMVPSQWDEFSHWLHSARYLIDVESFPRPGLPENRASFPAYPYGLPEVSYLAGLLAGGLVEAAGIAFNLLLLVGFGLMLSRLIAIGLGRPEGERPGWGVTAAAMLAATLLCPTFVPKVALTAYAEVGTAAAVAASALLGWFALERLAEGKGAEARRLAWQMGLVLALLIGLKQATLALVLTVLAGVGLAALRDSRVAKGAALALLPLAAGPAAVVHFAWRHYVGLYLPGREFPIPPLAEWHFELLPTVLSGMAGVAANKGGHFGLMLVVVALAVKALWRCRTPFDRLAIIAATVFVGYNLFLAWAYIAVFTGSEAVHVASYWRYNMHVGLLATAVGVLGLALSWRRWAVPERGGRWLAAVGLTAAVVAPLALADRIRFDIRAPKMYVRAVGTELDGMLPPDAKVLVVDPLDTGFYGLVLNYQLKHGANVVGRIGAFEAGDARQVDDTLIRKDLTHVWVHTQTDAIKPKLPLPLGDEASHLLRVENGQWRLVKSWPYPGYRRPTDIPDK